MSWFIVQAERKTWIKYIVRAADEQAAMRACDDWCYLGYVDGEETEAAITGGPFTTENQMLADLSSYVEG